MIDFTEFLIQECKKFGLSTDGSTKDRYIRLIDYHKIIMFGGENK